MFYCRVNKPAILLLLSVMASSVLPVDDDCIIFISRSFLDDYVLYAYEIENGS